jgi:hypothetical protein
MAVLVNASDHLVVLDDKVVGTISISGRELDFIARRWDNISTAC